MHLAIIADGNRRWAKKKQLPLQLGYTQGLTTIENCCEWCINNSVEYLTVFCFSTENWRRNNQEINLLMRMGTDYFTNQKEWYFNKDIKVIFKGRRDRLEKTFVNQMIAMEELTKNCKTLKLVVCVDYGGQNEIITAINTGIKTEEEMDTFLSAQTPFPDIMIRTGGEHRLSNFMLWQLAYTELFFIDTLFPDLNDEELNSIKTEFFYRKRNYGK